MTVDTKRMVRDSIRVLRQHTADFVWSSRHTHLLPEATLSPWAADAAFLRLHALVKGHTLVDIYRCYELWDLARQMAETPGDVLEVGVWRGGTGVILAGAVAPFGKTVFLADTFEGVVKAGPMDTHYKGGEHADASEETVATLAKAVGADNIQILKGVFPEDTAEAVTGQISLLHIDVDVYESARDVLAWAMPRLPAGAVVVFDDYGFQSCDGVTRFVDEFRTSHPGFRFLHNLNGHGVLIKLA